MKHKTFKEFLFESRLRDFKGWWKIGESSPRKIWSLDVSEFKNDKTEHYEVIFDLDYAVKKKFSEEDNLENIIDFALSRGWIRFGQVEASIHGSQTFIHFDSDLGEKIYYTVLKIINWLNLDNDDEISISGNSMIVFGNEELDVSTSVLKAKRLINNRIKDIRTWA